MQSATETLPEGEHDFSLLLRDPDCITKFGVLLEALRTSSSSSMSCPSSDFGREEKPISILDREFLLTIDRELLLSSLISSPEFLLFREFSLELFLSRDNLLELLSREFSLERLLSVDLTLEALLPCEDFRSRDLSLEFSFL